jgi:hypothetical protein
MVLQADPSHLDFAYDGKKNSISSHQVKSRHRLSSHFMDDTILKTYSEKSLACFFHSSVNCNGFVTGRCGGFPTKIGIFVLDRNRC